jgi:signal transduction histidine kinase
VAAGEDGRLAAVNRAALRILRPALDGASGRFAPADVRDDAGRPILALSRDALPDVERTLEIRGRKVTVVSRLVTLRSRTRRATGALEIFDDVTEVRALAERVRSLDRLASLGEATAEIAHQIRNPLSGVVGFAGLLRRSLAARLAPGDEALRYLEKVLDGAARADSVVAGTLALARRAPLSLTPVLAGALLREAALEAAAESEDLARRAIRVDAPAEGSGPEVLADREQLKQALLNLARNAIEAMAQTGGVLRLRAGRARGGVRLRVADTGPGVAADVRDRLFRPFVTAREGGTGLGLAFARKVVELHGGTIALEDVGRGASFRIDLPARVARPAPARTKRKTTTARTHARREAIRE